MSSEEKSIRFRLRVNTSGMQLITPGAIQQPCGRCGQPVWVDVNQELPEETKGTQIELVCEVCIEKDPVLWKEITENLPDIFLHWLFTGDIKGIRVEDNDEDSGDGSPPMD